ncbi:MAG: cytoplasmic protein [Candidatus Omnitrophota bacterium]
MNPGGRREQFGDLNASCLFCSSCGRSTPARERLLLVLPDGCLYEYRCAVCGTVTGDKKTKNSGVGGFFSGFSG